MEYKEWTLKAIKEHQKEMLSVIFN